MRSIRQRLRLEVLIVGAALAMLGSLVTGWKISNEVSDLLDYPLEQVARSLLAHDLTLRPDDRRSDPDRHLIIRIIGPDGTPVYNSDPEVQVPQDTPAGFSNARNAGRGGAFHEGLRVYTLQGQRNRIQVMQSLSLRRSLHWDTVWRSLWPALAAIVVLSVWIGVALRRALRPLDALSAALLARRSDALTPIELQPCPDELVTPVQSLNDLLRRLDLALQTQRRFTGDAAHELRTPLAALRLQAQNLAEATDLSSRQAQGRELLRGIDRCTHLLTQLLALARQDERAMADWLPVSLRGLAREALIDHVAEADAREVALALEEGPDASVQGHPGDLQRLLGNLLTNAIRHAPPGSSVSVAVESGPTWAMLRVIDDGPGMPPQDRARAFDRFFRGEHSSPGAGLGLAIVQQIAERHGAQASLKDKAEGSGLVAEVRFTRIPPTPA